MTIYSNLQTNMKTLKEKAAALLEKCDVAVVASVDENGYPRPVPLVKVKAEGIATIWFATGASSDKVRHFMANPKAGVCFSEKSDMTALTGLLEVVTDTAVKQAMWQEWFYEHFPAGPDDPEYILLKFKAQHARYWINGDFDKEAL